MVVSRLKPLEEISVVIIFHLDAVSAAVLEWGLAEESHEIIAADAACAEGGPGVASGVESSLRNRSLLCLLGKEPSTNGESNCNLG